MYPYPNTLRFDATYGKEINIKINDLSSIIYGIYYSRSSNIPRYDRLIMYDDIFNPKYAEWFYGPNTFYRRRKTFSTFLLEVLYERQQLERGRKNKRTKMVCSLCSFRRFPLIFYSFYKLSFVVHDFLLKALISCN